MKTTNEQRAELRARTPTSRQSMYQLYVRRAELHAVLDDLDEAEARAKRYRELVARAWPIAMKHEATRPCLEWLRDAGAALAETAPKTSERDGREGRGAVAPSPDVQLHPSRPAEAPIEPGTSSPDDAEIAAREWYDGGHRGVSHCCDECLASLAALLRDRDAQAREAGRVEAIEDVVAGFKAKVEAGYDVPPYVFAELTNALDSLNRPDRAK